MGVVLGARVAVDVGSYETKRSTPPTGTGANETTQLHQETVRYPSMSRGLCMSRAPS